MNTSETLMGFKFQMLQSFDEYLSNLLNCSLENCDSMINKLWVVALKMNLRLRFKHRHLLSVTSAGLARCTNDRCPFHYSSGKAACAAKFTKVVELV